jgi:hypothetical protein
VICLEGYFQGENQIVVRWQSCFPAGAGNSVGSLLCFPFQGGVLRKPPKLIRHRATNYKLGAGRLLEGGSGALSCRKKQPGLADSGVPGKLDLVLPGGVADDGFEVVDEMGLVEVAEVEGELGPIGLGVGVERFH